MSDCCDPDCQFNPHTGPRCEALGYNTIGTVNSPFNGKKTCNPATLQPQVASIEVRRRFAGGFWGRGV